MTWRRRINELIFGFLVGHKKLTDRQIVFAVRVIAPKATPSAITKERRRMTAAGKIKRSRWAHRDAQGRLSNLWELSPKRKDEE